MTKAKILIAVLVITLASVCGVRAQDTVQQKACSVADTLKWECKVYERDIYRIVVSGYMPRLDSVELYIGTRESSTVYLIREEDATRKMRRRSKSRR